MKRKQTRDLTNLVNHDTSWWPQISHPFFGFLINNLIGWKTSDDTAEQIIAELLFVLLVESELKHAPKLNSVRKVTK